MRLKKLSLKLLSTYVFLGSQPLYASTALTIPQVQEILARNLTDRNQDAPLLYEEFERNNADLISKLQGEIEEDQTTKIIATRIADKIPSPLTAENLDKFVDTIEENVFASYMQLKKHPTLLARQHFFESPHIFYKYVEKSSGVHEVKESMLVSYYMSGGKYYLSEQDYDQATTFFLKAHNHASNLTSLNPSLFIGKFHIILDMHDASDIHKKWETYQGLIFFYKMIMQSIGVDYKSNQTSIQLLADLHFKTKNHQKTIEYTQKTLALLKASGHQQTDMLLPALALLNGQGKIPHLTLPTLTKSIFLPEQTYAGPKTLPPLLTLLLFQTKRYNALSIMAESYYHLGQYENAQPILEQITGPFPGKSEPNTVYNHVWLCLIYAKQEKWNDSFKQFEKAYEITPFYFMEGYYPEDSILLMEVLLRNTKGRKDYINEVLEQKTSRREELALDIEMVRKKLSEEKIKAFKEKYANKFLCSLFTKAKQDYAELEKEYQHYWHKYSSQASTEGKKYFKKIDGYFNDAYEIYQTLMHLEKEQTSAVTAIIHARSLLTNLQDLKHTLAIEVQLFRSRNKSMAYRKTRLSFLDSIPCTSFDEVRTGNETAKYRKTDETVDKAHKKALKKEHRKQERHHIHQRYQERLRLAEQENDVREPETISYAHKIHSFKGHAAAHIWLTKDPGNFPPSTLELLYALNMAPSTYHLRRMLFSKAKLEILKGERKGQLSLRMNDNFRICFNWISGEGAYNVEITDHYKSL